MQGNKMSSAPESSKDLTARIVQKIKTLPPLPMAVQQLCRLADDMETDLREVDKVISADQALASRLLRVTNSAFYGLSRRVTTISQAVVVIGFQGVKNLALSVALCGNHDAIGMSPSHMEFWRHALTVACAARQLAAPLKLRVPEEAFTAGLLHDIGMLVMMDHFADQYDAVLREAESGASPLTVLERQAFGIDHTCVGKELCLHWRIPELLAYVATHHHDAPDLPGAPLPAQIVNFSVQIGNLLANIAGLGSDGCLMDDPLLRRQANAHLPPSLLCRVMESLPGEVRHVEKLLDLPDHPVSATVCEKDLIVRINDPGKSELVKLILAAWGCKICDAGQSDKPAVLITDGAETPDDGLTVLNLNVAPVAGDGTTINVMHLREWLAKGLAG